MNTAAFSPWTRRNAVSTLPTRQGRAVSSGCRSAGKWAERLQREAPENRPGQIRRAYRLAFSREATPDEIRFGERFAAKHSLAQLCLVLLNANEFLYVD